MPSNPHSRMNTRTSLRRSTADFVEAVRRARREREMRPVSATAAAVV